MCAGNLASKISTSQALALALALAPPSSSILPLRRSRAPALTMAPPRHLFRALRTAPPSSRSLSTSSRLLQTGGDPSSSGGSKPAPTPPKVPAPPKPIDDSTSALDFKLSHPRPRPPPLPKIDPPRWSAEEAVTNILCVWSNTSPLGQGLQLTTTQIHRYNTPPPSTQPFKRHVLNCLVQNEPGVLSRVSGILAARGFNIDSLVVCATEIRDLSRYVVQLSHLVYAAERRLRLQNVYRSEGPRRRHRTSATATRRPRELPFLFSLSFPRPVDRAPSDADPPTEMNTFEFDDESEGQHAMRG